MPIVTLQTSLLLDNSTQNQKLLLFVQTVHESLTQGITSRITTNKLKAWNEIKSNYPDIVNMVNTEITAITPGYFRSYKHELKALSSRIRIKFNLKHELKEGKKKDFTVFLFPLFYLICTRS